MGVDASDDAPPTGPLVGVRIVDLTTGIAGSMATMVFADQGAEVIKVEPPGGSPFRAYGGSVVWDRGKQSVVLDLDNAADRGQLRKLIGTADVLVESFAPGTMAEWSLDYASLATELPQLIYCSCTAYGRGDPRSDRSDADILVQAATGVQYEQPGWRDGPIYLDLPLPSIGASYLIQIGIGAALVARERTGVGQWVETSLFQGVLALTSQLWQQAEHAGSGLLGIARRTQPGIFECSDGLWVHSMHHSGGRGKDRTAFWNFLGLEPLVRSTEPLESERQDQVVRDAIGMVRRDDLLEFCWANDIPIAPVRSAIEALADPLLAEVGQVVDIHDREEGPVRQVGHIFRLHDDPPPPLTRGRPAVGEHTRSVLDNARRRPTLPLRPQRDVTLRAPLDGIKVVDLGNFLAGPYGPMILADLGADVVKVESVAGDQMRFLTMPFNGCSRGKRDIALDLKSEAGRRIAQRLLDGADVVHHNMRPGVAERLGVDDATARANNSRLVYCHTTMWGLDGPRSGWPGFDQLAQSSCGCEHGLGGDQNPPVWYRFGMCDQACAMQSVVAVLLALYRREQTGRGQFVDTSIVSGGMYLNSDNWLGDLQVFQRPRVDSGQHGPDALYRLYEANDGWIALACTSDSAWRGLVGEIPDLADSRFETRERRLRNAEGLVDVLEAAFISGTTAEWFARLDGADVPVEVADPDVPTDWLNDTALLSRKLVAVYDHPEFGEFRQFGEVIGFSATPCRIERPPPLLGEHTDEILSDLGFSASDIDRLVADGVTARSAGPAPT